MRLPVLSDCPPLVANGGCMRVRCGQAEARSRCSVCLSNSKQLFHHQTVLMTSHSFDFDAVTHSIKDVSVSTRQSLASSELFRIYG